MSEMKDVRTLIEQIDALLAINASGNAVPRIPGLAVELLTRSRAALDAALAARPAPEAGSLVERLRADDLLNRGPDYEPFRVKPSALRLDAADLIEAQADLIASLSAKVAEVERERDEARKAHDADAKAFLSAYNRATAAEARASELQREVDRLRAAIDDALGRHQITHIHAGLRAVLQQEGESDGI